MRLPPRQPETAHAAAAPIGKRRRRTAVLVTAALTLLGGMVFTPPVLRALRPARRPPAQLLGAWTAPAGRYAGRSFEVSETSVRIGVSGEVAAYPIADVRRRDSAATSIYTIVYRDGESELEFGVAIGTDSLARIRNLPEIGWRKAQP